MLIIVNDGAPLTWINGGGLNGDAWSQHTLREKEKNESWLRKKEKGHVAVSKWRGV